jgi:uncharacterized protein YciI
MSQPMDATAPDPSPPSAPAIEPIWVVHATYAPDASETRVPVRAEHLAEVLRRIEVGIYTEAGAFTDVSASVIHVRAASEAEALAIVSDDVYLRSGVWVELRARAFGRVTRAG